MQILLSSAEQYRTDGEGSPSPSPSAVVSRLDFGRLDAKSLQRTPQGGVRVPAYLTREGVLTYRNPDGSVRRELRPADEVFHADSLASLDDAPVTDLHPNAPVTAINHHSLSKGHVREAKRDGTYVAARLVVQDAALIGRIESGDRKEISCGYTCRFDPTPGEHNGERYDGIQREIRYNHVALGPVNWGRAGNAVALRLDGGDLCSVQIRADADEEKVMKIIKLDGKDYEFGSEAHLAKIEEMHAAKVAELAAATTAEKSRADKAEARADKAESDLKDAPAKLAAEHAARTALETNARTVLGAEQKFDGKSDEEIREMVVRSDSPKLDLTGKSADYVSALFDAAVTRDRTETPRADTAAARQSALESQSPKGEAPSSTPAKPLWLQPLALTKDK